MTSCEVKAASEVEAARVVKRRKKALSDEVYMTRTCIAVNTETLR